MVAIKHKKVTGRPVAMSDWDEEHVLTGTPGATIVFDEAGEAVEVLAGEDGTIVGPPGPAGPQGPIGPAGPAPDLSLYYTKAQVDAAIAAAIAGSTPAPTLAALSLSASSFTIGVATSGTINGATSGSTIALSNAPTGFTINSGARTWSYNGTGSASSGNLTLTETLSGATNTPRQTNIGYTVAAPVATLDPTLSTPVLIDRTSGGVIAFDVAIQEDYAVGDKIYLIAKNKAGSTVLTFSDTIDSTEATDTSAGTSGKVTFSGLSAVSTSTTYRWSVYIEKAGGASYGPSSTTVITGPDDIEPVLSSPTATNLGASFATIGVTTDDGSGTIYWVVTTSSTAPSKAQIKAGQDHTGATIPTGRKGSAAPGTAGAKTFGVTGTSATTPYYYYFMQEDAATVPNQSNIANGTYTSLASDPSLAVLTTTDGTSKHPLATVTGTPPLTFSAVAGNDKDSVRSTLQQVSDKAQMEITVNSGAAGNFNFGFDNGTADFSTFAAPGTHDSTGVTVNFALGQYIYLNENASGRQIAYSNDAGSVANGDIFTLVHSKTDKTIEVWRTRGGVTTQIGTAATYLSTLSSCFAHVTSLNTAVNLTTNFGGTTYAKTPGSGVASIWA